MGVQFLSEEYVAAAQEALDAHAGFQAAIAGKALALQFHITEMPGGGELDYFIDIADDAVAVGLGKLDDGDLTVTNSYETAAGISRGRPNTQMAFMTGKLKVSGDMAKLMLNLGMITEMTSAMSTIDTDY